MHRIARLEVPIVSFKSGKSFKYLLVRAKILVEKKQMGNFVVVKENTVKFAPFRRKKYFC